MIAADESQQQHGGAGEEQARQNFEGKMFCEVVAADGAQDDRRARRRIGERAREHPENARDGARESREGRERGVEPPQAEQRERADGEQRTERDGTTVLRPLADAAHVRARVRRHDPREVFRKSEILFRPLARKGDIEQAEQSLLFIQSGGATGAFFNVSLESFGGGGIEFAVEIGGHFRVTAGTRML